MSHLRLFVDLGGQFLLCQTGSLPTLHNKTSYIERDRVVVELFCLLVKLRSIFTGAMLFVGPSGPFFLGLNVDALALGGVKGLFQ